MGKSQELSRGLGLSRIGLLLGETAMCTCELGAATVLGLKKNENLGPLALKMSNSSMKLLVFL